MPSSSPAGSSHSSTRATLPDGGYRRTTSPFWMIKMSWGVRLIISIFSFFHRISERECCIRRRILLIVSLDASNETSKYIIGEDSYVVLKIFCSRRGIRVPYQPVVRTAPSIGKTDAGEFFDDESPKFIIHIAGAVQAELPTNICRIMSKRSRY